MCHNLVMGSCSLSVSVMSVAPTAPISQRGSRTSRGLVDALPGTEQLGQRAVLVAAGCRRGGGLPGPGHPAPTPGQMESRAEVQCWRLKTGVCDTSRISGVWE